MNRIEETTRNICENGDLSHDYAINLAKMVDARNEEIKRLLVKLEIAEKALSAVVAQANYNNCNWCGDTVKEKAEEALAAIRS